MTTIGGSATRAAWAGDSVVLGAMVVALVPVAGNRSAAAAGQVPVGFGPGPALPAIGLVQRLMFAMVTTLLSVLARSAATASAALPTAPAPAVRPIGTPSECGETA